VALILFVVLVTAGFDVGAYFVGRAFGRRLIAPVVSPQKTLEGLIGGVVAAFGLAAVLSTLPPFNPPITFEGSLLLAGVISLLAPLGDAAESVVKRALDVKDMGSILPGHGGMLDRIDALLFVVPAAYLVLSTLGYL
jgi:phosphatidate cytidylyltransferase